MKFIDLFAGLGGFHLALNRLGHQCVFASEIDPNLADLYEKNFGMRPTGDIRTVDLESIPEHDLLCAGFPCQPFSKAGNQKGLKCPQWGDLSDYIVDILSLKQPRFFIIENVPNLMRHHKGATWSTIHGKLQALGYDIGFERLSPHMFGIPQKRERIFVVGDREGLDNFRWPIPDEFPATTIHSVLDEDPTEACPLSPDQLHYLNTWQMFVVAFSKKGQLPTFPIWAMEFGANYPLDGLTPHARHYAGLGAYNGAFGKPLEGMSPSEVKAALPGYALTKLRRFPAWKIDYIEKNRAFYAHNRKLIDSWAERIKDFPPSFQKLEWHCGGEEYDIWKHVIQFRASGIRVRKQNTAPSLNAVTSQVPVIAEGRRYMTPRECARLQSMGELQHLPMAKNAAYKALGNAVNVHVVHAISDALICRTQNEELLNEAVSAE